MKEKKAIFLNTASQVIVKIVTLAFALISVKLLTNYLGTAGVGNFNAITTYINFFVVIADLGLFSVAVREISKDPQKEKKILSNVFLIRLISCIIAGIIAAGIVFLTHYPAEVKVGTLFGVGYLFFNLLSSVYDVALQYRLKMQFSALAEFLSKIITLIALFLIIRLDGGFILITSTIMLSGLSILILKWIFASRFIKFGLEYDKKITGWILGIAWPLGIVFIVNNLFFKLDTLMLYVIKGSVAVGIYSVSYKLLEVSAIVAAYFSSSLKPTISRNIDSDKNYLTNLIGKAILVLLLVAAPISAICIAFSKEIIVFLSNSDFVGGSNALILLSFTLPLIYLDTLLGEILIAKDSRKLLIKISIFILLFNFIANLIIIPRYSFIGAAFTTVLSELLLLFINLHYTRKIIPYSVRGTEILKLLSIFVLTIIFGFMIKTTGLYFLFSIAITVLFFMVLCQTFGAVKFQSLKKLLQEKT